MVSQILELTITSVMRTGDLKMGECKETTNYMNIMKFYTTVVLVVY